ncbi:hypothetical protein K1719_018417 [Acacia pycnantha]|nr:hypothetical protein K1719_018417 [Acacia pycnantha]
MEEVKEVNEADKDFKKEEKEVESEEVSIKFEDMSLELNQDFKLMAKDHESQALDISHAENVEKKGVKIHHTSTAYCLPILQVHQIHIAHNLEVVVVMNEHVIFPLDDNLYNYLVHLKGFPYQYSQIVHSLTMSHF